MFPKINALKKKERMNVGDYASLGILFGLILSVPLVVLIPLGIYVDKKIGSLPAFLLVAFFVALVFSSLMLYRVISDLLRKE